MNRKEIAKRLSTKRHNLQQVREALKLLEDINWRVSWALDFSQHGDINDSLDPVLGAISNAEDELQEQEEHLEQQLNEYRQKADIACSEVAYETLY